jgi:hypothetical protein
VQKGVELKIKTLFLLDQTSNLSRLLFEKLNKLGI